MNLVYLNKTKRTICSGIFHIHQFIMKKILVAFDNTHYSEGAMQFIAHLHKMSPVSVTGVFLPQIDYAALWSAEAGAFSGSLFVPLATEVQTESIREIISRFEQFCTNNKMKHTVHADLFDFTLNELQTETRFADMLVIGSELFYADKSTDRISDFLQGVLHRSECPVLLVPEGGGFPQINILTCDGSEDAVFAIKQFSYLLPELCNRKTMMIYLNEDENASIPEEEKLKDLLNHHFEQYSCQALHFDAKTYLTTWLSEQESGLLVSGAFGRSFASQLFKHSFIYNIITKHRTPVFIAHK